MTMPTMLSPSYANGGIREPFAFLNRKAQVQGSPQSVRMQRGSGVKKVPGVAEQPRSRQGSAMNVWGKGDEGSSQSSNDNSSFAMGRRRVVWSTAQDDVRFIPTMSTLADATAVKKPPPPAVPPRTDAGDLWMSGMRCRTRCWTALEDKTEIAPGHRGRVTKILTDGMVLIALDTDDMAARPCAKMVADPDDLMCDGFLRQDTWVSVADLMIKREGHELRIKRGSKGLIVDLVAERNMYVVYLKAHNTSVLVATHNVQPLHSDGFSITKLVPGWLRRRSGSEVLPQGLPDGVAAEKAALAAAVAASMGQGDMGVAPTGAPPSAASPPASPSALYNQQVAQAMYSRVGPAGATPPVSPSAALGRESPVPHGSSPQAWPTGVPPPQLQPNPVSRGLRAAAAEMRRRSH